MPTSSRSTIPTRSEPRRGRCKTAPCYGRMHELGAVFGAVYGWERPGWFAPNGYGIDEKTLDKAQTLLSHNHAPAASTGGSEEKWSFRRSNYFTLVGEECRHVSEKGRPPGHVGIRENGSIGTAGARVARTGPARPKDLRKSAGVSRSATC